jgi:hypothetical protein
MRLQSIKYTRKGDPYVTHRGQRLRLDEFMRVDTPFEHNGYEIHAVHFVSAWGGYYLHITRDGDCARVTQHYERG